MFRPRVIPIILIDQRGHAVKTVGFRKPLDLGDSINILSLFNAFKVDELVALDISAGRTGVCFSEALMADLASEAEMPFAVGGGVRTLDDIYRLLHAGAEKVVLRSAAFADPGFVRAAANAFASSSITVCLDVKRDWRGRYQVAAAGGAIKDITPAEAAVIFEDMGAGELIVQSVDHDGRMTGYDLDLTAAVADAVGIPVVALGGAGSFAHIREAAQATNASAFASGSTFCFQNDRRGVLINYPDRDQLELLAGKG